MDPRTATPRLRLLAALLPVLGWSLACGGGGDGLPTGIFPARCLALVEGGGSAEGPCTLEMRADSFTFTATGPGVIGEFTCRGPFRHDSIGVQLGPTRCELADARAEACWGALSVFRGTPRVDGHDYDWSGPGAFDLLLSPGPTCDRSLRDRYGQMSLTVSERLP